MLEIGGSTTRSSHMYRVSLRDIRRFAHHTSQSRSWKLLLFATVGISWYAGYNYFCNEIDRSSLLVRQTLYNMRTSDKIQNALGSDLRIVGNIGGYQSQSLAFADIKFDVLGGNGL